MSNYHLVRMSSVTSCTPSALKSFDDLPQKHIILFVSILATEIRWVTQHPLMLRIGNKNLSLSILRGGSFFFHCPQVVAEVLLYVHRNHRFIRDGSPGRPPRLSLSSWALCSRSMLLYIHRNCRFIRDKSPGRPPRLSHRSWVLCSRSMLLYIHRNCRFIRDKSPGCPPRLSHRSWVLLSTGPDTSQ